MILINKNSLDNPIINKAVSLKQSEERLENELFLIEEFDILFEALKNNFQVETLLYCPKLVSENKISKIKYDGTLVALTKSAYHRLALNSNSGIIAIMRSNLKITNDYGKTTHFIPKYKLDKFKINEKLIIILANPPNNILYLKHLLEIRIQKKMVLIFTTKFDIYQPTFIENYKDSLFSTEIIIEKAEIILNFVKENYLDLEQLNLKNLKLNFKNLKNKTVYFAGNIEL